MKLRLWYPQLDAYDSIRRMCLLLGGLNNNISFSLERLYIVDFYFSTPSLIHGTHMPEEVREKFRSLKILRPEKSFISLPPAPQLFRKMEEVQREAIRNMMGKGVLERKAMDSRTVALSDVGKDLIHTNIVKLMSADEAPLLEFLVKDFTPIDLFDIAGFRRRSGLRRVGQ